MKTVLHLPRPLRWTAGGLGLAGVAYVAYGSAAWHRDGQPVPPAGDETDPLLDYFMPVYQVAERHSVRVMAPAEARVDGTHL
jgi:hypothetical protein